MSNTDTNETKVYMGVIEDGQLVGTGREVYPDYQSYTAWTESGSPTDTDTAIDVHARSVRNNDPRAQTITLGWLLGDCTQGTEKYLGEVPGKLSYTGSFAEDARVRYEDLARQVAQMLGRTGLRIAVS